MEQSPGRTAEIGCPVSRPFGTCSNRSPVPNVKTLGYGHKSLRDEDLASACPRFRESNLCDIGSPRRSAPDEFQASPLTDAHLSSRALRLGEPRAANLSTALPPQAV